MWIALRLILAVVAFVIQVRRRSLKTLDASDRKGKSPPFFVKTHGSDKKITAITLGMRSPSSAWVQLSRERWTDRLAKALGLASELPTGDASFDYKIYVACDLPVTFILVDAHSWKGGPHAVMEGDFLDRACRGADRHHARIAWR